MILTRHEIDNIIIPANLCLIQLPQGYSKLLNTYHDYALTKDINIRVDTSFDPATHAPRWGTLIRNPKYLVYEKGNNDTIQWDCDIDTKEGDIVFFDYLACLVALGKLANPALPGENPTWLRCENDIYILIRYDALIFSFRESESGGVVLMEKKGDIICLNGHVILRTQKEQVNTNLILPDYIKRKESKLKHEVVFVGKANREYLDGTLDSDGINPGDKVVIKNYKIRLENSLVNVLSPDLVFVQQKHIFAILSKK